MQKPITCKVHITGQKLQLGMDCKTKILDSTTIQLSNVQLQIVFMHIQFLLHRQQFVKYTAFTNKSKCILITHYT